jgi:hypothetical protein
LDSLRQFALLLCVVLPACNRAAPHVDVAPSQPHNITLNWQPSATATSFNIYRALRPNVPYQKIGSSDTEKYVDPGVLGPANVFYVVTAVNRFGESAYSGRVMVVLP